MVWAIGSPKVEEQSFRIANGDFESMAEGELPNLFPVQFGEWSGNPAEVVKEASGNKILRFLRTDNVKGDPDGFASNCSVFQLFDLSALRRELEVKPSQAQYSLKLSAHVSVVTRHPLIPNCTNPRSLSVSSCSMPSLSRLAKNGPE